MDEPENNLETLAEKLQLGMQLVQERLVLQKRRNDEELVILRDGEIAHVKARDIVLPSEKAKTVE